MRDSELVLILLRRLVNGRSGYGVEPALCKRLRDLPMEVIHWIASYGGELLTFDASRLAALIAAAERRQERLRLIDELVELGAGSTVIQELFRIRNKNFLAQVRRRLKLAGHPGRPQKPDPVSCRRLLEMWARRHDLDPVQRLIAICRQVGIDATSAWQVIGEHEAIKSRSSRKINLLRNTYV